EVGVKVGWQGFDPERRPSLPDEVPTRPLTLVLEFRTDDGRRVPAELADLEYGVHTRTVSLPDCAEGCRLVSLTAPDLPVYEAELVLTGIRQLDPPADVVPLSVLSERGRWRTGRQVGLTPTPSGLRMTLASPFGEGTLRVGVLDVALPVPVAVVGDEPVGSITSVDDTVLAVRSQTSLSMLPRLG